MGKEELIELIKRLLKTDIDLKFLLRLDQAELEILLVQIRHRIDQDENKSIESRYPKRDPEIGIIF